jgi:hypothetical protein
MSPSEKTAPWVRRFTMKDGGRHDGGAAGDSYFQRGGHSGQLAPEWTAQWVFLRRFFATSRSVANNKY